MHAVNRPRLSYIREKLFASYSAGYNIAYQWIAFRQISCKIHLFPKISIYWNFIKCFWSKELGYATSLSTNYDWYSPVNAKRFSKDEVYKDLKQAKLIKKIFHEEEACFSGRFVKQKKYKTINKST
jgi:hypothetical protein